MKKLSEFQKMNLLQIITCVIVVLFVWFLSHRNKRTYTTDPDLMKEMRTANAEQREARIKQLEEAEKNYAYLQKRDSLNQLMIDANSNDIKKFKKESNEKISAIGTFNSRELVRAFADLQKQK